MTQASTSPSARQVELLDAAYAYALQHGLVDLSLRPLASAIGSSPRVLLFLFGSKDGLVRALLERARRDELAMLSQLGLREGQAGIGLAAAAGQTWVWLVAKRHRPLLRLWVEAYARSLVEPDGAWAGFARTTVEEWLEVLAASQPASERATRDGVARRTLALTVLRGALLDLLATGDEERVSSAVRRALEDLR